MKISDEKSIYKAGSVLISKGVGTSGIPFRFNCKPEIVIVEFVSYDPDKDSKKSKK